MEDMVIYIKTLLKPSNMNKTFKDNLDHLWQVRVEDEELILKDKEGTKIAMRYTLGEIFKMEFTSVQ